MLYKNIQEREIIPVRVYFPLHGWLRWRWRSVWGGK